MALSVGTAAVVVVAHGDFDRDDRIDIVLAAACNAYEDPSIGMQVNIAYIERPAEGDLFAQVEEVSRGGRIAHYTIAVTDARGVEVSRATAITYIKRARG